jgi:hypothetical protein
MSENKLTIASSDLIGPALLDALNIPKEGLNKATITLEAGALVVVEATYFCRVDNSSVQKLPGVIRETYKITAEKEKNNDFT